MMFPKEKEHLVLENAGLVKLMASRVIRKYKSAAFDIEDLMQIGFIGLMRAIEKFDPDKGYTFSTFACSYIKGYMMREGDRTYGSVTAGVHVMMLSRTIRARGHENEDPKELAKTYKYTADMIRNAQRYARIKVLSNDFIAQRDDGQESDLEFQNLFMTDNSDEEKAIVNEFISMLKPQHQEIINRVMKGEMLTEIARDWGKSRQRVHNMRYEIQDKWNKYERGLRKI